MSSHRPTPPPSIRLASATLALVCVAAVACGGDRPGDRVGDLDVSMTEDAPTTDRDTADQPDGGETDAGGTDASGGDAVDGDAVPPIDADASTDPPDADDAPTDSDRRDAMPDGDATDDPRDLDASGETDSLDDPATGDAPLDADPSDAQPGDAEPADTTHPPDGSGEEAAPEGFVRIRAGTYVRGSPLDEPGRDVLERQHEVTLTRDFFLGRHEVTRGEWQEVDGTDPSFHQEWPLDHPVEQVNWWAAAAFTNWRSERDGLDTCYTLTPATCADDPADWVGGVPSCEDAAFAGLDCTGYRLPTEAEWEYAARAGTTTATWAGPLVGNACRAPVLDAIAWYCGNAMGSTQPVGTLAPNPWGLFDMLGNVGEWNTDRFGSYPTGPATDPIGPPLTFYRVIRGGAWSAAAVFSRAAFRSGDGPPTPLVMVGLRLARTAPQRR